MKCLYIIFLSILSLLLFSSGSPAKFDIPGKQDSESLYFNHLSKADGLPSDVVRYVMQDVLGYIYIGTDNGLVRYDGHEMKIFQNNSDDPTSIAENKIYCIFQSRDSLLWIGTVNGFSIYDPLSDRFTNYNANPGNPNQFPEVMVGLFLEDRNGSIWIASSNGLIHYNRAENKFHRLLESRPDHEHLENQRSLVFGVAEHPTDTNLIILTTGAGILFIDRSSYKIVAEVFPDRADNFETIPLYIDGDSVIWTGSLQHKSCLKKLHLKTLKWEYIEVENIPGIRYISILNIEKKNTDELWLGTVDHGLGIYNKKTGEFSFHQKTIHPKSLKHNMVRSNILTDRNGNLWLGELEGLSIQDKFYKSFRTITLPYGAGNAHSFFHDNQAGKMYFGTTGEHNIVYWDEIKNEWGYIPCGDAAVKPYAGINCFYKDGKGVIWAGSAANNLLFIDPKTQTLKMFRDKNMQPVSFKPGDSWLFFITGDNRQNLWISAQNDGIIRVDSSRQHVSYFKHQPGEPNILLKARRYTGLMFDGKKRLFIGTIDGWDVFDTESNTFNNEFALQMKELGLYGIQSNYFAMDTLGRIWVSVYGKGLLRITESGDSVSFRMFQTIHGLNDPGVGQIVVDRQGNFWIINEGLVRFNPYSEQFTVIDERTGLHSRKTIWNKIYIDHRDNIFLDGIESFETQNLADLKISEGIVNMLIDHVEINGSRVLKINPQQRNQPIIFKSRENNLRFSFPAICFEDAHKIIYEYQLIGFDKTPSRVAMRGSANYTNLPPGKYRFVVRASHRGIWHKQEAFIDFIKKPYYYQTLWFFIVILLVLTGLTLLVIYIRTRQISARERIRTELTTQIAESEMKSLRAQMNPHFIFNSLNSINTFILKNQTETASDYLTKFSRLMRAVLNNSKHKLVSLEDELQALKIYLELEQLRFNHKFDFKITIDQYLDANRVFIPPMLIQPYVENAIWHGLMYKDDHGKIDILAHQEDENIRFTIIDNGIGREKAKTYKSAYKLKGKSLGMSITADRIATINKLYQCEAKIAISDLYDTNQQATGTQVTVILPIISNV